MSLSLMIILPHAYPNRDLTTAKAPRVKLLHSTISLFSVPLARAFRFIRHPKCGTQEWLLQRCPQKLNQAYESCPAVQPGKEEAQEMRLPNSRKIIRKLRISAKLCNQSQRIADVFSVGAVSPNV